MNKRLVPTAQKADKRRHLNVTKTSMVVTAPFTILGSFFIIIPALSDMVGGNNALSQSTLDNAELLDPPVTLFIGMMSVYVTMCTAYDLGDHYKLYIPDCVTLFTFALLFAAAENMEDGISITNPSAKGLFCAILVGMAAVGLYRFCKEKNLTVRMPEGVPDFVSKSFGLILAAIIVAGILAAARFFSQQIFGVLPPQILTQLLAPLVGSMDSLQAVLFLHFITRLIFSFGTHSSVFGPVTRPIMTIFTVRNIIARQAGEPLSHLYTAGVSSTLFGFTGVGITTGCVVTYMLPKSRHYRKIGQIALFPPPSDINEPILFGAPIILNPIMFILLVFGGAIVGTIPVFSVRYGLLDKPFFDPPYVGIFLEGFLTDGDWGVILACGVQLILAILFYPPFLEIMECQELREEEARVKKAEEVKDIFSDGEEALLNDLDPDFQQ